MNYINNSIKILRFAEQFITLNHLPHQKLKKTQAPPSRGLRFCFLRQEREREKSTQTSRQAHLVASCASGLSPDTEKVHQDREDATLLPTFFITRPHKYPKHPQTPQNRPFFNNQNYRQNQQNQPPRHILPLSNNHTLQQPAPKRPPETKK